MTEIKKPWNNGKLKVSGNKKYLQNGEVPFFWMGDTAWLLFQKLTLEESYIYLKNRKEKGFNVIQAVMIQDRYQTNAEGSLALHGEDFRKPNLEGSFWTHIDKVISMAEALGLYMGLLPIWGSCFVKGGHVTLDNVGEFTTFITKRYNNRPNIIWITGGDVRADVNPEVFVKMAEIMKKVNADYLITYHPFGRTSSSFWFQEGKWLDFNMFQSGHRRYDQMSLGAWDDNAAAEGYFGEDNWKYVLRDHSKSPIKPTVDGEPSYEGILQGLHDEAQPYWEALDVRRYAYWSVFAGAMGHTYGDNSIMQFYQDSGIKGAYGVKDIWQAALHHAGSAQMKHLVELMTSVNFMKGQPADELLVSGQKEKYDRVSVFASEEFVLCYDYNGNEFTLDLTPYKEKELKAYWYDPTSGVYSFIGNIIGKNDITATPQKRPDGGSDWVLVIK
ncbi:MAG: glycoside hydrolase family 140 protein [Anaerocolumna sp.]